MPFDRVVEVAQTVHRVLDKIGAASCCKTSGKRGMHVFVPLGGKYDAWQVKALGELVCMLIYQRLPEITTRDLRLEPGKGRVYLDHTRNARGRAVAAAYSVRPWAGATVSVPLKWSEVRRGLDPSPFTIQTMPERIAKVGDLWAPVLGPGIDLGRCLQQFEKVQRIARADP